MAEEEGYNGAFTGAQIDAAIRKVITDFDNKVDKTYVDGLVGDINTILDTINGEVV